MDGLDGRWKRTASSDKEKRGVELREAFLDEERGERTAGRGGRVNMK